MNLCENCPKQQNECPLSKNIRHADMVPSCHLPLKSSLNKRYCIGHAIGQGGFGITYIGYDIRLKIKIAIKECFPRDCIFRNTDRSYGNHVCFLEGTSKAYYQDILEKFHEEAETLIYLSREIKLEGIVTVYDYFEENGTAYMVMDFVEGQNLNEYAQSRGNCLSVKETLELMYPVGQTIARLHQHDFIHRDISPENIMIQTTDNNLQTILIDFGASREFYNHSKNNDICNMDYSPPEQLERAEQGPYTDVYAYCATIYRLITGQTIKTNELIAPFKLGIHIKPAIKKALLRGLASGSSSRYQTMEDLLTDLYQKPLRRRKIIQAVIVSTAVFSILYFIFLALKKNQDVHSNTDAASTAESFNDIAATLPEKKSPVLNPYTNEQGILELDLSGLKLTDLDFLETYSPHDLSDIQSVNLSENSLCDISGLKYLPNLTVINLRYNVGLQDIQPLSALKKLRTLDLSLNDSICDFSVLNDLSELESLILYATKVKDINFAENLPKLKSLNLENCLNLSDISVVSQLQNLDTLNISSCYESVWQSLPKMEHLKSLYADDYEFGNKLDFTNFPNLETLSLSNTDINLNQLHSLPNLKKLCIHYIENGLENLAGMENLEKLGISSIPANLPLETLTHLKELDISCSKETDLDLNRLSALSQLKSLDINGTISININSLLPLKELPLETLNIHVNQDCNLDFAPLSGLQNLKNLSIHSLNAHSSDSIKELDLQFLDSLKYLETLDLNFGTCTNYDAIKNLVKLKSLKLAYLANISDIEFLSDLKQLTELELEDIGMADFQAAENLSGLKSLYLMNAEILNPEFLSRLTSLEDLRIDNIENTTSFKNLDFLKNMPCLRAFSTFGVQIDNISGFSNASSLISIHIDSCSGEEPLNLNGISSLPGISSLSLSNTAIDDIAPLSKLKHLSFLNLDGCSFSQNCDFESSGFETLKNISARNACLPSIQWLKDATSLRTADITSAAVQDLSDLSACVNLHTLSANNMDQLQNLEGLQNMKNLRTLNLNDCISLSDLKALDSLINLEDLSMDNLRISDLSNIKNLAELKCLSCAKSDVSDLSALSSLKKLEDLNLSSTPVKDLSPLSTCSQLEYLYLNNTAVETIADLKNLPLEVLSVRGTNIPALYKELSQFTSPYLYLDCDKNMLTKKQKKKLKKNFPDWSFY